MKQELIAGENSIVSTREGYRDKLLWWVAYPVAALAMIFIANDNSLFALLKNPSFYTDLLFAFSTSFLCGWYIRKITIRFDVSNPWHKSLKNRAALQLAYGVLLPLTVCMLLEVVYLAAIHLPLKESSILILELPLAFLFLLLANLFYTVHYLFYNHPISTITRAAPPPTTTMPGFINVQEGFTEKRVPINNCAIITSRDKMLWIRTFDGVQYRVAGTMDDWEQQLGNLGFYRLNRQYLVAHRSILAIEQTNTRKILVQLSPAPAEPVYVSKEKSTGFQKWWRNG